MHPGPEPKQTAPLPGRIVAEQTIVTSAADLYAAPKEWGGKGHRLGVFHQAGLRVPTGLILNSDFVAEVSKHSSRFLSVAPLLERFLGSLPPGSKLMVRSCGKTEDGDKKSLAGSYESIEDCEPTIAAIEAAVHSVALSNPKLPCPGVIIQLQIDALYAGIGFSDVQTPDGIEATLLEFVPHHAGKLCKGEEQGVLYLAWNTSNSAPALKPIVGNHRGQPFWGPELEDVLTMLQKVRELSGTQIDIEWVVDKNKTAWLVQVRPVTASAIAPQILFELTSGIGVSPGKATGTAQVLTFSNDDLAPQPGAILVAKAIDSRDVESLSTARGFISEQGSFLCHPAIVAREYNIPCIVGVDDATKRIKNGDTIEMDGSTGNIRVNGELLQGKAAAHSEIVAPSLFEEFTLLKICSREALMIGAGDELTLLVDTSTTPDMRQEIAGAYFAEHEVFPDVQNSMRCRQHRQWRRYMLVPGLRSCFDDMRTAAQSLQMPAMQSVVARVESSIPEFTDLVDGASDLKRFVGKETAMALFSIAGSYLPEIYGLSAALKKLDPFLRRSFTTLPALLGLNSMERQKSLGEAEIQILEMIEWLSVVRNEMFSKFKRGCVLDDDFFDTRKRYAVTLIDELQIRQHLPAHRPERVDTLTILDLVYKSPVFVREVDSVLDMVLG